MEPTQVAVVVDQYNLMQEVGWGAVDHTPDGPEEGRPRLVVETDDNTRLWQTPSELTVLTPSDNMWPHIRSTHQSHANATVNEQLL